MRLKKNPNCNERFPVVYIRVYVCGRISPTAHVYRTYTYETQEIVKLTIMIVQLS